MPGKTWSSGEKRKLRRLVKQGVTTAQMLQNKAWFSHKTRDAILQQKRRMKLSDPKRRIACQNATQLSPAQREVFEQFLRENYERCTPEELAKIWNKEFVLTGHPSVKHKYVCKYLQQLGIKKPEAEVRQMPGSVAKRRSKAAGERRNAIAANRAHKNDLAKFTRAKGERGRLLKANPELPQFHCVDCKNDWPLTDFFWHRIPARGKKPSYLQKTCCLICLRKRARERNRLRRQGEQLKDFDRKLRFKRYESTDVRIEQEFEALRAAAAQLLQVEPSSPVRCCIDCDATYPLTEQFFSLTGKGYFRQLCKICVKLRATAMRRMVASGATKKERQVYRCERLTSAASRMRQCRRNEARTHVDQHYRTTVETPFACCSRCEESWPLEASYWRLSRKTGKPKRSLCLFCDQEDAVQRRLAKKLGINNPDRDIWRSLEAEERFHKGEIQRALARKQALGLRKKLKQQSATPIKEQACKCCGTKWPLDMRFWKSHCGRSRNTRGKVYFAKICRYCFNERSARKRFSQKWKVELGENI